MSTPSGDGAAPVTATRLVNGVFEGGGAKGIAYAGALRAMEERNLWFGSVAGTSVGAVTAALIAAGMTTDELIDAVPQALGETNAPLSVRLGKAVIGHATSVFESKGLRVWLDTALSSKIGELEHGTTDRPVTFADLHRASGIELYVVAMDLADGLPVIFSRRTTPDAEVAGAVLASAAVPMGFPPGRAVYETVDGGAVVHQLVDGMAWANYPAFVFDDRGFRAWVYGEASAQATWGDDDERGWRDEDDRPMIGLILTATERLEHRSPVGLVPLAADVNRRFDQGPTYTSPKRGTFLLGAVLSSDWARVIITLAMAVWIALSVATLPVGARRLSTWLVGWMPDIVYPFVLVGTLAVVVLALVVSVAVLIGVIMISRILADTLLPSIKAMIGVPMDAPPWIGLGSDSVVIRVPYGELSSGDFDVPPDVCTSVVDVAHVAASRQLDDEVVRARLESLFDGREPAVPPYRRGDPTDEVAADPDVVNIPMAIAAFAATSLIGVLAWWATNSAGSEGIGSIMLAVIVAVVVGGAALWFIGGRAGARSAMRARFGVGSGPHPSMRFAATAVLAGVVLIVGGMVLSIVAMDDRAESTVVARVLRAVGDDGAGDGGNVYAMSYAGGEESITVSSDRHLRLGSETFVSVGDDGTARVVGALDDGRFAIAVVLWALGLGLITTGVRWYRWTTRCRNLDTIVTGWRSAKAS